MNKLPSLSAFFPFWNEGENIERVVQNAIPVLKRVSDKWELIIVDDGSSDNTLEKANKLAVKYKNVKVVGHTPNRGYGAALKEGFSNSSFEYVVFTDGDGQFDFSQVDRFIKEIRNNDLVIGFRGTRRDTLVRHALMNMLKVWDYLFFGFRFKDIDCGFKMFKREALDQIMPLRSEGAMITTEILAKAKQKKLSIAQVSVGHYPREFGKQTGANFFVIARAVLESLTLWSDMRNGRI